jgi:2-polyprenyl-3-methyl-5-hydroxy-6-metoxy-1,4-benzoquinol methylase
MGEIFKYEKSTAPLGFSGERFTTAITGQIELEHIHRYLMARSLCRGKNVLDIASGEGYGAAILAQVARSVVGIDVDHASVTHAAQSYKRPNLRFVRGDARRIPLSDASINVVTSFETLEHFLEHGDFFREVNRVLSPEGFLLISTPDCDVYSPSGCGANPFHVRELSREEFVSQLSAHFPAVSIFRQQALVGSLIAKASSDPPAGPPLVTYDKRDESHFEENTGLTRALYLIAIASKASPINAGVFSSVLIDTDRIDLQANNLRAAKADIAAARNEITRLQDDTAVAQIEIARLQDGNAAAQTEIARLQKLCDRVTGELEAIRTSSSWRLTGPIRGSSGKYPQLGRSVKRLLRATLPLIRRSAQTE